jgi:hypothetical protein
VKTQQQLELFAAPVDPYQARVDAALHRALHTFGGAKQRWNRHRKHGLTAVELKEVIADEFGIYGGGNNPEWHCETGGEDPKFWLSISNHGKPTLSGKPLLERVRELLKIPYPLN